MLYILRYAHHHLALISLLCFLGIGLAQTYFTYEASILAVRALPLDEHTKRNVTFYKILFRSLGVLLLFATLTIAIANDVSQSDADDRAGRAEQREHSVQRTLDTQTQTMNQLSTRLGDFLFSLNVHNLTSPQRHQYQELKELVANSEAKMQTQTQPQTPASPSTFPSSDLTDPRSSQSVSAASLEHGERAERAEANAEAAYTSLHQQDVAAAANVRKAKALIMRLRGDATAKAPLSNGSPIPSSEQAELLKLCPATRPNMRSDSLDFELLRQLEVAKHLQPDVKLELLERKWTQPYSLDLNSCSPPVTLNETSGYFFTPLNATDGPYYFLEGIPKAYLAKLHELSSQ